MLRVPFIVLSSLVLLNAAGTAHGQKTTPVRFNEDIRPILSNHCWNCHGPDEASRQANLRLDLRDAAIAVTSEETAAIVPGSPEKSTLIERIESHDADLQMPPAAAKKPLTEVQKQLLVQWIQQGAEYAGHWAFEPPQRPEIPQPNTTTWARNEIDLFVLKTLEDHQLSPSREASPANWLRRVTLDLTGLPPSIDELTAFEAALANQPQDVVYPSVVDRLLSSPQYGERMAMVWLDAARYADTNGYNNDETRTMWPWRDWVIRAFADGMPYDQFLVEQIAGDQLPNATIDQKVATGFNRNHVLTTEGGIIEEEYHVEYVADRVHTTATVFMAMSLQCARCHDHKYDPISQKEFYQFAAYFNNIPDRVVSYDKARMAEPLLKVPSPEQQAALDQIDAKSQTLVEQLKQREEVAGAEVVAWEASLTPEQRTDLRPEGLVTRFAFEETDGNAVTDEVKPERIAAIQGSVQRVSGRIGQALAFDGSNYVDAGDIGAFEGTEAFTMAAWIRLASNDAHTVLSRIDEDASFRGYDLIMEGGKIAAHFVHAWPNNAFKVVSKKSVSLNEWHHIAVTYDGSGRADGVRISIDGMPSEFDKTTDNPLTGTIRTDKPFHIGRRQNSASFQGQIDDVQLYSGALSESQVASLARGDSISQLAKVFATPATDRTDDQRNQIRDYYLTFVDTEAQRLRTELAALPKQRDEIEEAIPATMVMAEPAEPRSIFVLKRGQYDQRAEEVGPGVPQALSMFSNASEGSAPEIRTRLELARWLTDPRHPLTARVAVNRLWEMVFGIGLVETSSDFGVQGALPSHPELLDWLATELIRQKWDQREILRKIVLSATYRQTSDLTSELLERDPENRLLARSPRFRLPAETVRDTALFVSGLLKQKIGGPSVKPYQPEGLWEDVSVERRDKYVPDTGDGLYRRSMYTFWKRTCPPPGMATFDAPDRETCVVRRARTNTPLQALVLLNDPTFVEAARILAERTIADASTDPSRIRAAYRRILCREPDEHEAATLSRILNDARQYFAETPAAADELLAKGNSPKNPALAPSELAAWSVTMNMLLNLDEAVSRN
jgi:hypothetical protein